MEFIGGFLVAVFIYVYGSYCGIPDLQAKPGNGKLRGQTGSSNDRQPGA
jgi:hypothetical protein